MIGQGDSPDLLDALRKLPRASRREGKGWADGRATPHRFRIFCKNGFIWHIPATPCSLLLATDLLSSKKDIANLSIFLYISRLYM